MTALEFPFQFVFSSPASASPRSVIRMCARCGDDRVNLYAVLYFNAVMWHFLLMYTLRWQQCRRQRADPKTITAAAAILSVSCKFLHHIIGIVVSALNLLEIPSVHTSGEAPKMGANNRSVATDQNTVSHFQMAHKKRKIKTPSHDNRRNDNEHERDETKRCCKSHFIRRRHSHRTRKLISRHCR